MTRHKEVIFAGFIAVLLALLAGYNVGLRKGQQLQPEPVSAIAIQAAVHAAIEPFRSELEAANQRLDQEQAFTYKLIDSLGKAGQIARSKPAKPVTVTSVYTFECDSAKLVGKAMASENERLREAHSACQELVAAQDTALLDLGAELEAAERRHYEDQAEIAAVKKQAQSDIDKEVRRKKAWRIAAIALAIKETADYLLSR